MKRLSMLVLVAAALAFGTTASAQDTIKIGLTGPFTGGSAPLGVAIRDGVRLAVSEINAKGGVLGKKIALVERDDESKPERSIGRTKGVTEPSMFGDGAGGPARPPRSRRAACRG